MKYSYNAVKKLLKFARQNSKKRTVLDCAKNDITATNIILKRYGKPTRVGLMYRYLYKSKGFVVKEDTIDWF